MRVAIVHYQLRRGGGMESYLADLVRGFRAAGDSVDVWAREVDAAYAEELGASAFRLLRLPMPRLLRNRVFASRIAQLELTRRYPLVITLARTRGHHIAVNGGTHPGFMAAMGRLDSWHDRTEVALEQAMLADAGCIVAHSKMLGAELQHHYPAFAARVQVLYPPVDGARFSVRDEAARARLRQSFDLSPEQIAFVFPSMDHARKGLDPLLAAFARLGDPRARLFVAGRSPKQGLPAGVTALGYVRDMPALFAAADWTVLPSRYEPFGLVVAESLACGTPAIVGRGMGVAELIGEQDGIRLEALDEAHLLAALQRACAQRPRVAAGFVERHGLTLAAHIEALKHCPRVVEATGSSAAA